MDGNSTPRLIRPATGTSSFTRTAPLSAFLRLRPSGVDKFNGYRHAGDTAILSYESKWGIFRTGAWYDWAYTDRYQYPSNTLSSWIRRSPNFHEHFITRRSSRLPNSNGIRAEAGRYGRH